MAAFIDEAKNNPYVITLVLYASIENVPLIADIPNFFPNFERSYPCIDVLCTPCFWELWWACSKFPCVWRVLFTFYLALIILPQFPGCLENLLLSTHLRIFDFRFRITELPVPWCLARFFFFHRHSTGLTRDPKLDEEVFSLYWLRITRFTGLAFAVGEPSFGVVYCPRFDMAPITVRSLTFERKLLKWLQEYIEKLIKLNKHRRWFHSLFEKLPLVRMSASWFLVSAYVIWILGSKLILSNNQSGATLWVLDMSHRRTSSFYYHFDHGFVVFKDVQLRFTLRRMCVGGYIIHFTQLLNL